MKQPTKKCYDCNHCEMCAWIKEVEEQGCEFFDNGNKWIPCSERLPLHGSRVLVTATHKKLGHTAVDVLRYHGDEYGWEGSDICIVTAWMPLPEAMKEGESNG